MNKSLLYVAPIALIGFMASGAVAAPAALSSIGQNITAAAPEGAGAPLVLVQITEVQCTVLRCVYAGL